MDFPDFTDRVILFESILGTTMPDDLGASYLNQQELVESLELRLLGWGPNREARALLKRLAQEHNQPGLAEGLHSDWRREQIAAVVREIFNKLRE